MAVMEKRSLDEEVFNSKHIVLDIEGTTTSISYVKDTLFPYVRQNLDKYVTSHWDEEEFKSVLNLLKTQAVEDLKSELEGAFDLPSEGSVDDQRAAVVKNVLWQMDADRKTTALKKLQGLMWRQGYKSGELHGHLFPDVAPALREWVEDGRKLYIYSSGSVEAQKLLFGHSTEGDLTQLFTDFFDTEVGPKVDAESYKAILVKLNCSADDVLFLTDMPKEASAARQAGLPVVMVERSGNEPIAAEMRKEFSAVSSFQDLSFTKSSKKPKLEENDKQENGLKNPQCANGIVNSDDSTPMEVDKNNAPISELSVVNEKTSTQGDDKQEASTEKPCEKPTDEISKACIEEPKTDNGDINSDNTPTILTNCTPDKKDESSSEICVDEVSRKAPAVANGSDKAHSEEDPKLEESKNQVIVKPLEASSTVTNQVSCDQKVEDVNVVVKDKNNTETKTDDSLKSGQLTDATSKVTEEQSNDEKKTEESNDLSLKTDNSNTSTEAPADISSSNTQEDSCKIAPEEKAEASADPKQTEEPAPTEKTEKDADLKTEGGVNLVSPKNTDDSIESKDVKTEETNSTGPKEEEEGPGKEKPSKGMNGIPAEDQVKAHGDSNGLENGHKEVSKEEIPEVSKSTLNSQVDNPAGETKVAVEA